MNPRRRSHKIGDSTGTLPRSVSDPSARLCVTKPALENHRGLRRDLSRLGLDVPRQQDRSRRDAAAPLYGRAVPHCGHSAHDRRDHPRRALSTHAPRMAARGPVFDPHGAIEQRAQHQRAAPRAVERGRVACRQLGPLARRARRDRAAWSQAVRPNRSRACCSVLRASHCSCGRRAQARPASSAGAPLVLGSSMNFAIASILYRDARLGVGATAFNSVMMLLGAVCLALAGVVAGEPTQWRWSGAGVAAMLYLALFGSALAYTSYTWLLKRAPADRVGTFAYVNPAIATVLGWAVLGEALTGIQIRRRPRDSRRCRAGDLVVRTMRRTTQRTRSAKRADYSADSLEPALRSDQARAQPGHEPHDHRGTHRRPEPGDRESGHEARDQTDHRGVEDEEKQAEGHERERQRQDEGDRTHHRVDDAEEHRRDRELRRRLETDPRQQQARQPRARARRWRRAAEIRPWSAPRLLLPRW